MTKKSCRCYVLNELQQLIKQGFILYSESILQMINNQSLQRPESDRHHQLQIKVKVTLNSSIKMTGCSSVEETAGYNPVGPQRPHPKFNSFGELETELHFV